MTDNASMLARLRDKTKISGSAINTWLNNVDLTVGPDCEDSPHFRRTDIDYMEAMRLLVGSGFDFLPDTDLRNRSWKL